MAIWTIEQQVHVRHRPRIENFPPQYGGLEFIASHDAEAEGVAVELLDQATEASEWLPDILTGINEYQAQRMSEVRAIGKVRLRITKIHSHPIDTNSRLMRRLAREAIRELFEQHETEVPAEPMSPNSARPRS
jgi:hypothetical protein